MDKLSRGGLLAPVAGIIIALSRRSRSLAHAMAPVADPVLLDALASVDWRNGVAPLPPLPPTWFGLLRCIPHRVRAEL
jgi:hypothetical protein